MTKYNVIKIINWALACFITIFGLFVKKTKIRGKDSTCLNKSVSTPRYRTVVRWSCGRESWHVKWEESRSFSAPNNRSHNRGGSWVQTARYPVPPTLTTKSSRSIHTECLYVFFFFLTVVLLPFWEVKD